MTKDGRPSRINDIRLFWKDANLPHAIEQDALAFVRRLVWYLNGEDFSLGTYPALYIRYTSDLAPGVVVAPQDGGEWWHKYADVGVPPDFLTQPEASHIVRSGTVAALKAIRPDLVDLIDHAHATVENHGAALRFPVGSKKTARGTIDVAFSIPDLPSNSVIHVSFTETSTGGRIECRPIPFLSYGEPFNTAATIRLSDVDILSREPGPGETQAPYWDGIPGSEKATPKLITELPPLSKLVHRGG